MWFFLTSAYRTGTLCTYVRNVMDKLALHSRLQIAAYAHSHDD